MNIRNNVIMNVMIISIIINIIFIFINDNIIMPCAY